MHENFCTKINWTSGWISSTRITCVYVLLIHVFLKLNAQQHVKESITVPIIIIINPLHAKHFAYNIGYQGQAS